MGRKHWGVISCQINVAENTSLLSSGSWQWRRLIPPLCSLDSESTKKQAEVSGITVWVLLWQCRIGEVVWAPTFPSEPNISTSCRQSN